RSPRLCEALPPAGISDRIPRGRRQWRWSRRALKTGAPGDGGRPYHMSLNLANQPQAIGEMTILGFLSRAALWKGWPQSRHGRAHSYHGSVADFFEPNHNLTHSFQV